MQVHSDPLIGSVVGSGVWGSDSGLFSITALCQMLMAKQGLRKRGRLWTHPATIA